MELSDQLTNGLAQTYREWDAGYTQLISGFAATRVKVLLWGPGVHSGAYDKRRIIKEHLYDCNNNNEIITSEELIQWKGKPIGLNDYDTEELHWVLSDVILVLIVSNRESTGSRFEASMFGRVQSFMNKAWLILPTTYKEPRGFLDLGINDYPMERKLFFSEEEYADCTRIRSVCTDIVEKARNKKAHKILLASYT